MRTTADLVRFAVAHGITVAPRALAGDGPEARPEGGGDSVLVPVDLAGGTAPSA